MAGPLRRLEADVFKKILQASEAWVGLIGLILPVLPISEEIKKGLVYPIWTYVSSRIISKTAKAVIK